MKFVPKTDASFPADIARLVWESKYRWHGGAGHFESGIEQTWQRVAHALATSVAGLILTTDCMVAEKPRGDVPAMGTEGEF